MFSATCLLALPTYLFLPDQMPISHRMVYGASRCK